MIGFDRVLAIARAELRLTRRLVRYWVFLSVAGLGALLGYLQIGFVHGFFSTYSATVSALSPRFMIGFLGLRFLLVFTVGLVFLGFDVRARDRRERMVEVLDSRPFTNLELLSGRFFALLLAGWVPLVLLTLLVDGVGALLQLLKVPFGETIEPVSLVAFTVFMALPSFAFAIGLVFLITLLVRHRLVAAVLLLAALGGMFWATLRLPLAYGPFFDLWGAYMVDYPSDIIPGIADGVGWLQRFAVLLAGFGWLALAAAVHPRLDGGSRPARAGGGALLVVAAVALMATGAWWRLGDVRDLNAWKSAHEARAGEATPDLVAMVADLALDPGDGLSAELEMRYRAPADAALATALFTLNPGLRVEEIADPSGRRLEFSHHDGLLEITHQPPLAEGAEQTVRMRVNGKLNPLFGYLDSVRVLEDLTAMDGAIYLLGYMRALDDSRYVALMPGVRWLPAAGSDVRRDDARLRPRDYFDIELTVDVPDGWLAAGPGRREELAGGGSRRFRFAPGAPVHEVALLASEFEAVAAEVAGVPCELLLFPDHLDNLQVLGTAASEMRRAAGELLTEAADNGLPYPYSGFTVVEVPNALRGFAGGWRLDTALAPPSMMLLRESGFPSARFDVAFRKPDSFQDREGGLPRAMLERVESFFHNDFSGGNLFTGAARSFFLSETSAAGPEGLALNFTLEELGSLVVTDSRGYFSAHIFDRDMGESIQAVLASMGGGGRQNIADSVIDALSGRPAVWDEVLEAPLTEMDPWSAPRRSVDVLTLKAGAMSESLDDALGRSEVARLLAALRSGHAGSTFRLDDVIDTATALGHDVGPLLEDWLYTTELPAFVGEDARAFRLPDGEDGSPRYQLLATVRNDEAAAGLFRVAYRVGGDDDQDRLESDPIRLDGHSAVRWGAVSSRTPQVVTVEPYLSLNREPFRIPFASVDEQEIVNAEPVQGTEPVEWTEPDHSWIVVDDLDPGFEIIADSGGGGLRLLGRGRSSETDGGLPLMQPFRIPASWSRTESATAWGRYRHTIAVVRPGKGRSRARFTAAIPTAGAWELEIHLCHKQRFRAARNWGTWKLEVRDDSGSETVEFDAGSAPRGWNLVGSFDVADGTVVVELLDSSTGQVVIADAIRWVPASANGADRPHEISEGDEGADSEDGG